jgi:hypothetical protein
LDEERANRLKLMDDLNKSGLTTQTIADLFNALNIPTSRRTKWSTELVWGVISKWRKRQQRLMDEYLLISTPRFFTKTSEVEHD